MIKKLIAAIGLFIGCGFGQQQQTITLSSPTPSGVAQGSANLVGNAGISTYSYWIIAKYPRGNANHSPRIEITNAPNTLSGSNYVRVSWQGVTGATGYDVVKSTSPTFPGNGGNIALVTNTASFSVNDTGQSLTSYTVSTIPLVNETWYLDNQNCANAVLFAPSITGSSTLNCTGASYLRPANNLSDLANVGTARTNLGLTTTATTNLTSLLLVANNLSELTANAATVRTNIGVTQAWLGGNLNGATVTGGTANNLPYLNGSGVLTANDTAGPSYVNNALLATHIQGKAGTPTLTWGTGAGTTAPTTVSFRGTDLSGVIAFTTTATPAASAGLFTLTFNTALATGTTSTCQVGMYNNIPPAQQVWISGSSPTIVNVATNTTALAAASAYVVTYHCNQVP